MPKGLVGGPARKASKISMCAQGLLTTKAYLLAESLLHLREQGELHVGHAAESEMQRQLRHSVIDGDQVISQQPELVEEDGRVVLHVGHIK